MILLSKNRTILRCFYYHLRCHSSLSALPAMENYQDKLSWKQVINEAERVVGYPTSFLNLRWLLNDEVANVAFHIKKLIGTNHPILKIIKKLLTQDDSLRFGLVVLLLAKTAGLNNHGFQDNEKDVTSGILHSQRVLAEVTEMINTSHNLHNGIISVEENVSNEKDLKFGNHIALLCGDFLLSKSFQELAELRDQFLNELMSSALRDLAESQFIEEYKKEKSSVAKKKKNNSDIPSKFWTEPIKSNETFTDAKTHWTIKNLLGGASLLAKSCQGALILSKHSSELQEEAYNFGRNFALSSFAVSEMECLKNSLPLSLQSAPVMFHLEENPADYDTLINSTDDNVLKIVKSGLGLEKTVDLQKELSTKALEALRKFPSNDSKTALTKMLKQIS